MANILVHSLEKEINYYYMGKFWDNIKIIIKGNINEINFNVRFTTGYIDNIQNQYEKILRDFSKEMDKYQSSDIVEFTKIVKTIFADLDELGLLISFNSDCIDQEVYYHNGYFNNYSLDYKVSELEHILIKNDYNELSIKYNIDNLPSEKETPQFMQHSIESTQFIQNELDIHLKNILALKQMSKSYQEENTDKSLNLNISK